MSLPNNLVSSEFVAGLIAKHVQEQMISDILTRLRETLNDEISKMAPEVKQVVQDFVGKVVVEKVFNANDGMPVINVVIKGANR